MLGIALGITVLITVLSVMNGFDEHIRDRVFSMARQVSVSTVNHRLSDWQALQQQINALPGVKATAPYIQAQAMISSGTVKPTLLNGIDPAQEAEISELGRAMQAGQLSDLKAGQFGIILGQTLAATLGANLGEKVTVVLPEATVTPLAIVPRFKRFTVVGIFNVGSGFGYDTAYSFIHLADAQKLLRLASDVNGVQVKLADLYEAPQFSRVLQERLPVYYTVSNWTREFGAFFGAIQLEKTMMFFILLLIIAVAAFNLVSTLVMVVADKTADIAILRTLGATPGTILRIFIVQGTLIGVMGTILGLFGGILLAENATAVVQFIEQTFHTKLISSNVYYVNFLPSKLEWLDVANVCIMALAMSLLATLYPAWRAARTQPAEALRYE